LCHVPQDELLVLSWREAQDLEQDRERPEVLLEDALRKRAEVYRNRLYRDFGNRLHTDSEAFAMALRDGDQRLPTVLMESQAWAEDFEALVIAKAEEFEVAR